MASTRPTNLSAKPIFIAVVAAAFGGCAANPSALAPAGLMPSADAPEWAFKSTYIEGRSMFGVGSSAGVRNVGLARTRAANRARNELAKLLDVYSASLMKDYMASASTGDGSDAREEQRVEQAVKTFTAQLLVGVEVTEFYADQGQGVLYALAELDLDRQAAIAAAKAKMGPGLQAWVDDNRDRVLEDLESDMRADPPAPPPAPPAEEFAADDPAGDRPPAAGSPGGPSMRTCDSARFLCATGQGPDRESADVAARAELARIFESNIQSVAKSYASAAREISDKTGEQWIETQSFSQMSMVTTDKAIRMSRILGRWIEGGLHNALAGIDRAQAANDLRDRIQAKDEVVTAEVARAEGADDPVRRLRHARSAIEGFVAREALNSDLRVVRADGRGIPAPVSMADLLALLDDASRQLRFGIALAGPGADRMQACLEESLTDRGYEVESRVDEQATSPADLEGDFDVLIKGKLAAENRGKIGRSALVQVRLTLRLINGKTGRILKTISGAKKGSRRTAEAALSTATYQLCKTKVPGMIRDIDRYFVR